MESKKSMQQKKECEKEIEMEYEKNARQINDDYAEKYDYYFDELEKQKYDNGDNEEIEKVIENYVGVVFERKYYEILNRIIKYDTDFDEKIDKLMNERDEKLEIEWNKMTDSIEILFDKKDKTPEDV